MGSHTGGAAPPDAASIGEALSRAGFLAPDDEAAQLCQSAAGDPERLSALLERRLTGEPLAWIVGHTAFCGLDIRIDPGVYVPRAQTEDLARRATKRLPPRGTAVDICTGSGAVAAVLMATRPRARVIATDIDAGAVACAHRNGVDALAGDLFAPLPQSLMGRVEVVTAVVPYVPTPELPLLQRDTFTFETPLAYDGGPDGTGVLRRVVTDSARFLRPGGALLLELGGDQARLLRADLLGCGFGDVVVLVDDDGDVRGVEATLH